MARRFGGKHSPDMAVKPKDTRVVDAAGARANVLAVPAAILAFTTIGDGATEMAMGLTAAGALGLAAWLLREGLRAEAAYNLRTIAKRPAIPRKMFATALTGVGVGLATLIHGSGVLESGVFGVIAGVLHVVAFGIDPLKDKRVEGIDSFQQDRVAKVVDEAESYLDAITGQVDLLRDRDLTGRVQRFTAAAKDMIRTVEQDPRDLTGARKFLGVYLMGARDATARFVDLYGRTQDVSVRRDYEALLTDLETNFAARTQKMLLDDRSAMDIEINVLRDRLERDALVINRE